MTAAAQQTADISSIIIIDIEMLPNVPIIGSATKTLVITVLLKFFSYI